MEHSIVNYTPELLKKQVDLLWEVTDAWEYPFGTSYASVEKVYSSKNFDPTTRFYVMNEDKMIAYLTSAVVKDDKEGDYGSTRFPMSRSDDPEIVDKLMDISEKKFQELEINVIKALAGPGMGNTMELAKKYGFENKKILFKRSKISIEELKVSGNFDNVRDYNDNDSETIKELFLKKMGITEEQGQNFYSRVLETKKRKENIAENRISWKIVEDDKGIAGFSFFHRSDHNPSTLVFAPIWTRDNANSVQIVDNILSAHLSFFKPHGLKSLTSFLPTRLLYMDEFYNNFGFNFDPTYLYEKIIVS